MPWIHLKLFSHASITVRLIPLSQVHQLIGVAGEI